MVLSRSGIPHPESLLQYLIPETAFYATTAIPAHLWDVAQAISEFKRNCRSRTSVHADTSSRARNNLALRKQGEV